MSKASPQRARRWTREALIAALHRYQAEFGRRPSYDALRRPPAGYPAAERFREVFGTWSAALEAAEIAALPIWTGDSSLEALRAFARVHGRPPTSADLELHAALPGPGVLLRLHGSVRQARELAGVGQPPAGRRPRRTEEEAIAAINEAAGVLGHAPSEREYTALGLSPSAASVRARLGSWQAALVAAGVATAASEPADDPLARLRSLADVVGHAPTMREWDEAGACPTGRRLVKRFGSWRAVLQAAGLTAPARPGHRQRYSREHCIEALQIVARRLGRAPTLELWGRIGARPTAPTIIHRCGSWTAALKAAGLSPAPARVRARVSDRDIIDALRGASVDGVGPTRTAWESEGRRPSAGLIVDRFGGWDAALAVAGLARPARANASITREAMVTAVRQTAEQLGRAPSRRWWSDQRMRPSIPVLVDAFGSWPGVLEAAGLNGPVRLAKPQSGVDTGRRRAA
jgi:hypothetical protein